MTGYRYAAKCCCTAFRRREDADAAMERILGSNVKRNDVQVEVRTEIICDNLCYFLKRHDEGERVSKLFVFIKFI